MSSDILEERISITNIVIVSLLATLTITGSMWYTGTDIVKSLGIMVLGSDSPENLLYSIGAGIHITVGLVFAIIYTLFFAHIFDWSKFTKGIVFGCVITTIALTLMPVGQNFMMQQQAAWNTASTASAVNNPCSASTIKMSNPCTASNPCSAVNPCAASNPCDVNPCAGSSNNPCAGSNPCSGQSDNIYAGLISLAHHILFALVLAFGIRVPESYVGI